MAKLDIGIDFNDEPSGRFYTDGPGSGEEFREEHLKKLINGLNTNEKLTIVLDNNVDGFGSSFLVEGFAGMVKYGYVKSSKLLDSLEFQFEDEDFEFYRNKIIQYISEAEFDSEEYKSTKA
ncbi:DUF4325 domain-containing protein [Pseudoalteromonas luteoviolacea]|uniref:DUF4325 domain-containing protein n=1 Tax=Pseudoalteromonas luteoviolacea TaxID=43657 RepID=UPI00114EE287|nr:DUF4325 domain-containing protein [Pseudoalteromonas luteoviolacea]TQF72570.1 DUF4325 domain-containing protein [Pseudoalteromonas luteoviolacea]